MVLERPAVLMPSVGSLCYCDTDLVFIVLAGWTNEEMFYDTYICVY